MFLWLGFCVFGKVAKLFKMLVFLFPVWGGGVGGEASSWLFGFGRSRCFWVSCFCLFLCWFWFFVFLLCFCFVVGLFLVLFLFVVFGGLFRFCFIGFVFVGSCLFWLFVLECFCCFCCFLLCHVGLLFCCSLCLLERSRCCLSFLLFWFVFCVCCFSFFVLGSFCSSENHSFPCNSSVLGLLKKVNLCILFLFLVLAFVFVVFDVCFMMFFCFLVFLFFCLLSCFVLNQNILFVFTLRLVFLLFFVFVALAFCQFLSFGDLSKKHLSKTWKFQNKINEKCRKKTDILTRTVSTGVFTNSVFCVSFNVACFAENTIKIGVSAPPPQKKQQKKQNKKN